MSALNLATIVLRLQANPRGWRVEDLCEELGIAARTYRKYRKLLQDGFVPFFRRGSSLVQEVVEADGRYLRLVEPDLGDGEVTQLLTRMTAHHLARSALESLRDRELTAALDDAFAAAWTRVTRRGGRDLRHLALDLDRLLHYVPDAPKDYSGQHAQLTTLVGCLMRHQRIKVRYAAASSEEREHELEPLTLALFRGGLHLLARYGGSEKVYNFVVDRMRAVEPLPEHFDYPDRRRYRPERFTEDAFGIFFQDRPGPRHRVELVFANLRWLKVYLQERRWHPTQSFRERKDGKLELRFDVASLVEVEGWVRQFGPDVEVKAPKELRAAVAKR